MAGEAGRPEEKPPCGNQRRHTHYVSLEGHPAMLTGTAEIRKLDPVVTLDPNFFSQV